MKTQFISMCLLHAVAPVQAAEITVKKLNADKDGPMVFGPSFVKGAVGVIQADKAVKPAEVKSLAAKEQTNFALGKTRFDMAWSR